MMHSIYNNIRILFTFRASKLFFSTKRGFAWHRVMAMGATHRRSCVPSPLPGGAAAMLPGTAGPEESAMIWNQWYAVLATTELTPGRLFAARRMGEDLVFARDVDGRPFCLRDRCAYRGAALSKGPLAAHMVGMPFPRLSLRFDRSRPTDPGERKERTGSPAVPGQLLANLREARLHLDLVGRYPVGVAS